ncbi:phage protein NinX family protein [Morganella morganii]|uniref:phage protein NinX family protein n=1 Tax=Morganella morganii TaxID=582 RepID=UPI0033158954
MNKYRDKSDFEINKAVAEYYLTRAYRFNSADEVVELIDIDLSCEFGGKINLVDTQAVGTFDPCNNPADAWPIILKNRISIIIPGNEYSDGYSTPFAASGFDDVSHITRNTYYTDEESFNQNPLRAAMEVFLMMKDAENEK